MTNEEKQKLLKPGERLDDLQIGGLELIQDPDGFCFGVDAVFLSDFAKVRAGETVLDLGTGNGIIPVLLCAKTEGKKFTGLEIQADTAEMARRSVALNGLEDRVEIVTGDIREASQIFKPVFFDVITTNPPYMPAEHGIRNPDGGTGGGAGTRCCARWTTSCGRACGSCRTKEGSVHDPPTVPADRDPDQDESLQDRAQADPVHPPVCG